MERLSINLDEDEGEFPDDIAMSGWGKCHECNEYTQSKTRRGVKMVWQCSKCSTRLALEFMQAHGRFFQKPEFRL
jgi:hypothetical protein